MKLIQYFSETTLKDIGKVGGKNASLGEMIQKLQSKGIDVPDGFATTSEAYWLFLDENKLRVRLDKILSALDTTSFDNLPDVGMQARQLLLDAKLPDTFNDTLREGYDFLLEKYGQNISFAVRSSATAEDLPTASFAGQQESYLNVRGFSNLLVACQHCFASLFTDRAIKYRVDNGFDHMKVALSVGVQLMIRSDLATSGVMFSIDPDTGFENVVHIAACWGLGENIVQGTVNPDEFFVFKPSLIAGKKSIVSRSLGSKKWTMVYADDGSAKTFGRSVLNRETSKKKKEQWTLTDAEIETLARWAVVIEEHYGKPMDIEWAKDGKSGKLFIVQARPETVQSRRRGQKFVEYKLKEKGKELCKGIGLGSRIVAGKARLLRSPSEADKLQEGEILVTGRTNPDWDPILKKAAAIITDQGGRTSHAAIVARELGAVAVVGAGNATAAIRDGQLVTVSAAGDEAGRVYDGKLDWTETEIDLASIAKTNTKVMLILGDPDQAFRLAVLPNDGVGLMRMEFIITNAIGIHPMALRHFEKIADPIQRERIEQITHHFPDKEEFFVQKLAEATATIAAAFFPKDVIVRMSDFKSNEYATLLGGKQFEPTEENPMIGFRGASRYYHPMYREGFEMECRAMKIVREDMGLHNVKLMIPFCRTVEEGKKVISIMESCGLRRGENGLEIYVMVEIPSNALRAEDFARHFDGFSIGSNDLTQLTLGADRDSELLQNIFNPYDSAVMQLIEMTLKKAQRSGTKTGLCGQAPSDYPEFARFLVEQGIDSISFNPDALLKGIENILHAEEKLQIA